MGDLLHGLLALRHGKGFRAHLDLHKVPSELYIEPSNRQHMVVAGFMPVR
jgi:hypothetical protein